MKKTLAILGMMLIMASVVFADMEWTTYQSKEFNLQFDIPDHWQVETDDDAEVPSLMAHDEDSQIIMMVLAYKDESISTEDLFDQAVDNLDMEIEGEAEHGDHNGMDSWFGLGDGTIDDEKVGIVILAATYDENNYVVYIFTPADVYEDNVNIMDTIINSVAPLEE